jgi:hypothetical protein
MQPEFSAAKKIIKPVQRQIRLAKRRKDIIVFVELRDGYSATIKELWKTLGHYDNHIIARKNCDDGSGTIQKALKRKGIVTPVKFRVCGVNTPYCVWDTIVGLLNKYPDAIMEVSGGACSSYMKKESSMRKLLKKKRSKGMDPIAAMYRGKLDRIQIVE